MAFAAEGMMEYHRATGDDEALRLVFSFYSLLVFRFALFHCHALLGCHSSPEGSAPAGMCRGPGTLRPAARWVWRSYRCGLCCPRAWQAVLTGPRGGGLWY